jgi:hypothetical protein
MITKSWQPSQDTCCAHVIIKPSDRCSYLNLVDVWTDGHLHVSKYTLSAWTIWIRR